MAIVHWLICCIMLPYCSILMGSCHDLYCHFDSIPWFYILWFGFVLCCIGLLLVVVFWPLVLQQVMLLCKVVACSIFCIAGFDILLLKYHGRSDVWPEVNPCYGIVRWLSSGSVAGSWLGHCRVCCRLHYGSWLANRAMVSSRFWCKTIVVSIHVLCLMNLWTKVYCRDSYRFIKAFGLTWQQGDDMVMVSRQC